MLTLAVFGIMGRGDALFAKRTARCKLVAHVCCACMCCHNEMAAKKMKLDDNRFPKQQGPVILLYFHLN
jgi:hypothetical protein